MGCWTGTRMIDGGGICCGSDWMVGLCCGVTEWMNYSMLELVPSFRLFMAGRERTVEWSGVRDGQANSIRDAVGARPV